MRRVRGAALVVAAAAALVWGPALYAGGPDPAGSGPAPAAGGPEPAAESRGSEPTLRRIGRDIRITGVPPRGVVGRILRIAASPAQESVMIEVAPAGRGGDARGGAPQRGDRAGADTPTGAGSQIRIHGLSMATVRELGLDHLAGTAERLRATRRDSPAGPRIRLTLAAENGAEIALLGDDSGPNAAVVAGRRLQAADSRQGRPSVLLVHAEEHHTVVPGEQVRLGDAAGIGADARHDPQGAEAWTFLLLGARLAPASDGADGADGAVGAEVRRASFDWIAVRRVE